jgi:hypothetical protein
MFGGLSGDGRIPRACATLKAFAISVESSTIP